MAPHQVGVLSPWQTSQLQSVVWADITGATPLVVTRAEAMSVPAFAKARHVLVGQLAGLPLRALRGPDVLPDAEQPTWLYSTSGNVSPWHRMAWTVDDLWHFGWSLWWTTRGAEDRILTADRVPWDEWEFTSDGYILVGGRAAQAGEVILFPGPTEGVCASSPRTIRAARDTEDAWQGRVRSPIPVTELHQLTDDGLTEDEAQAFVDTYVEARRDVNGAVTFTPSNIELRVHGEANPSMLVEARNAIRVDVANLANLPAAALDGSVAEASLTYTNQEGRMSDLAEGVRFWGEPITARLSQDDVVPRGQRVRFDTGDRFATPPNPTGAEVLD